MEESTTTCVIPNIEVDDSGVPVITHEEMVHLLNEATGTAWETASHISSSLYAEAEKLENKKYKSTDVNDLLLEAQQRNIEKTKLVLQAAYWNNVFLTALKIDQDARDGINNETTTTSEESDGPDLGVVLLWALGIIAALFFISKIFS